jgi:hypothetical protein
MRVARLKVTVRPATAADVRPLLYQHFGFEPTGPMQLPEGAPVLTPMWRGPTAHAHG